MIGGFDVSQIGDPLNLWLMMTLASAGFFASLAFGHRFLPDAFAGRATEWLGNKAGHIVIGLFLVILLAAIWRAAAWEYPDRLPLMLACILGPAAFELSQAVRFGGTLADKFLDVAAMAVAPVTVCWSFRVDASGALVFSGIAPAVCAVLVVVLVLTVGAGVRGWPRES